MSDPIACQLDRLSPHEQEAHAAAYEAWNSVVLERSVEPGAVRFRLPADHDTALHIAEFAMRERICCPFFSFSWEANGGPEMTFRIAGPPGSEELLHRI